MASRSQNRRERADLERSFDGPDILAELLQLSGSPLEVEEVAARMKEAQEAGEPPSAVFPTFFEEEPRFQDPELARKLYGNLFGLWELIESGAPLQPGATFQQGPARARKEKKTPPPAPGKFGPEGPDDAWVETAWRYLEELDERGLSRLEHAFENRQDALLGFLDDERLTDEGYALARQLLFELFSMIELGAPNGVGSADPDTAAGPLHEVPPALREYAEETLLEAEQDEDANAEQGKRVREKVERGLAALWAVRKR